jgi:hypothetical protein
MEEKYYEILRHYVNPNDCAIVVKQLLSLHNVSQQRELLIDFSKKIMFGEDWTPPLPYEQMVDDYLKGN